jgi:hypothetical protein
VRASSSSFPALLFRRGAGWTRRRRDREPIVVPSMSNVRLVCHVLIDDIRTTAQDV